jgi:phage/plasmid-like protein (TIGR03299 family)
MAFVGEKPWHGLGQKLEPGQPLDVWAEAAGFNWTAEKAVVQYDAEAAEGPGQMLRTISDRFVLYRSDTGGALGLASGIYKIVQPAEVLEFYGDLVDVLETFAMETAGVLKGGRRLWALARSTDNGEFYLPGDDKVERFLLMATSFDCSLATIVKQTAVRVVCNNTLTLATATTGTGIKTSHTQKFDAGKVKSALGLDAQWNKFAEQCWRLSETQMLEADGRALLAGIAPKHYSEAGTQKWIDSIVEAWHTSPGSGLGKTRQSAWGLLNGVTFWADHMMKARSPETRLSSVWFGQGGNIKRKAFEALAEVTA